MATILETNTKAGIDNRSEREIYLDNQLKMAELKKLKSEEYGFDPVDQESKSTKSNVDTNSNIKALPGYPE
jgi:hypothetical protein